MLTCIVHQSVQLVNFLNKLELPLTAPQKRHLTNLVDAILVTDGKKPIANLQRQLVRVRRKLQRFLVRGAVEIAEAKGDSRVILIAVDDSIRTWKGMAFVVVHVLVGSVHLAFDATHLSTCERRPFQKSYSFS